MLNDERAGTHWTVAATIGTGVASVPIPPTPVDRFPGPPAARPAHPAHFAGPPTDTPIAGPVPVRDLG